MVEDDNDSDYGQSKKKGKKVIRRGRTDKKEKKSPKPRLKATGILNKPLSACLFFTNAPNLNARANSQTLMTFYVLNTTYS